MAAEVRIDRTRLERVLSVAGTALLRRRTRRVEQRARELASVHGSMADGIESFVQGKTGVVRSTHPASIFVLKGTPKHIILPRRNRRNPHLRFNTNGRTVFAKIVHHPGYKGDDFLSKAVREVGGG